MKKFWNGFEKRSAMGIPKLTRKMESILGPVPKDPGGVYKSKLSKMPGYLRGETYTTLRRNAKNLDSSTADKQIGKLTAEAGEYLPNRILREPKKRTMDRIRNKIKK